MPRPLIRVAFFDYGGVLTPFQPVLLPEEREAAARAGIDPAQLHVVIWRGVNDYTAPIGPALRGETGIAPVIAERREVVRDLGLDLDASRLVWRTIERPVLPEMVDLVRAVRAAGVRTALASNQYTEFVPVVQAKLQLDELFDDVIFSCDPKVALQKPTREFFEYALRRNRVDAAHSLFVDDAPANIETALSLGMHAILVEEHARAAEQIRTLLGIELLARPTLPTLE